MRTYFKTDFTRLNHREMWRISGSFVGFLLLLVQKYLRIPILKQPPQPADDELHLIEERDLHPDARAFFARAEIECAALSMTLAFYATVRSLPNRKAHAAFYLSDDGKCWASAVWTRVHVTALPRIESGLAFSTKFSDGTFFSTTNIKQRFDTPPGHEVIRMPGATAAALEASHYESLQERRDKERIALDAETLKQISVEVRRRIADYLVARGIWVPLSEREVVRLEAME